VRNPWRMRLQNKLFPYLHLFGSRLPRATASFEKMPFQTLPGLAPIFLPGQEPLPPGFTDDDRQALAQQHKMERYMTMGQESCVFKAVLSGGAGEQENDEESFSKAFTHQKTEGFGLGAFFSLMSATFAYEDPLLRAEGLSTRQKTTQIFKEMGRNMWRSGKGFGRVGALYSATECVIESVSHLVCLTEVYSLIPTTRE
jgi:hypothetical protein